MSCKIRTTHRLQFSYFFPSHSIHLINKLRTAKKCNPRNGTIEKLQEVRWSVDIDQTDLIENLSPHSTRGCFKILLSFSSYRLTNQLNRINLKANTSNKIADLLNSHFSSLFQKKFRYNFSTVGTPYNPLNGFHHQFL